jgi:hypothetical protein
MMAGPFSQFPEPLDPHFAYGRERVYPDVPFDTADPTFRFGHGLRYS